MTDKPNTQVIIRHIAGAKINRIDPFALADTTEITFGREAGSTVMFDSPKDDMVSRKHAVLRIKNDDHLLHNVHSSSSHRNSFNFGQPVSGISSDFKLKDEEMLKIGCDVHRWMTAWIGVVDHPYFAVSGTDAGTGMGSVTRNVDAAGQVSTGGATVTFNVTGQSNHTVAYFGTDAAGNASAPSAGVHATRGCP